MKVTASNRILALLIKILLGLAAAGYIIYQLYYTRSTDAVMTMLTDPWQDQAFPALLVLVFMLMPVNWGLEALKWKLLAGKIEPITYGKSLQAVVSGLALGVLTPNRVGEFLGRMLSVEKADRREALSASVVGSFSQLIVTLIFGALASIHYLVFFSSARLEINNTLIYTLAGSFLICCVLVLVIYFHLGLLYKAEPRKRTGKQIARFTRAFLYYRKRDLMVILLLSLLRYIVFSYQYYLLLGFFGLDLYLTEAFMFIAMIYFIVALIPTVALTEIGIKGSAAVFLLSGYYGNEFGIIAASFSLWIVNLAIPSLAGAVLLYRVKIFRDKNAV